VCVGVCGCGCNKNKIVILSLKSQVISTNKTLQNKKLTVQKN
jgi:hypothetical protein